MINHNHKSPQFSTSQSDNNLTCPVMKNVSVNKDEAEKAGLVRNHQGKKYYFCCESCLTDFDQNPKSYVQ